MRYSQVSQRAASVAVAVMMSCAPAMAWRQPRATHAATYDRGRYFDNYTAISATSGYPGLFSNLTAYPRGLMITIDKTLLERPKAEGAPAQRTIDHPRQAAERLAACWSPPLPPRDETVEVTIRLGFNNRGETLAPPHITYVKAPQGTSADVVRASISAAVEACTPLRLSAAMANSLPGNPVAVRFVGHRYKDGGK